MISVQGLTKYYGDACAIEDLTFEIDRGEIVGIVGLNGAGKTTTLRILSCLLLPSAGQVHIHDLDIYENPHEIRKQVGFLPEEPPLYREMTVESFLVFAAELRGLSRQDAKTRTGDVLELTNTKDVANEVIANLSHGYRKRVGIAQSIVHEPPVLILDEPISGLDPVQIVEIREMIRTLKGSHTILLSSHILPEISQTCDRILMVQQGRLVATGTEEELIGKLTGATRLLVTIHGDQEKATQVLEAVEGVEGCKQASHNDQSKTCTLEVSADRDVREAVSRAVVGADLGLLLLRPAESELESAFIQLSQSTGAASRRKEVSR